MTALVVPIDVAALCVGAPDVRGEDPGGVARTLPPMADFSVLPYVEEGSVHNPGPYLSADVLANSDAFSGAVPLVRGIHLHWALPAGLSRSVQGADGNQEFPAVPERWLVTRVVVDTAIPAQPQVSTRSWVVESDRLSLRPTAHAGLQQPTVPSAPAPGQNFRYLGASFDLPGWREQGDVAERLRPFGAVGYGEPAFAGFYPNSCTSFGFLDPLADLSRYQPATSTVSYHVAGWYGDADSDPLRLGNVAPTGNRYGWTWAGTPAPTATVCSGAVLGIPWDPNTAYLGDGARGLTVTVADSGPEAVSALMASMLGPEAAAGGDIERLLNALQFGLLSKSAQVDSQPAFEEAMHEAGFAAIKAGRVWSVITGHEATASGDEVTLPDALAEALNQLNLLQLEADALDWEVRARQRQLFADWYKCLLIRYDPADVPAGLRDQVGTVQAYLDGEAQAIDAIIRPGGSRDALRARVAVAAGAIRKMLPVALSLNADTAAPPYREPVDSVLVLCGPDATVADRHRSPADGPAAGLPCRLDQQVITGATLDPELVPGSERELVAADELPGLAVLPGRAPAILLQALLREVILLSPALQPAVAAACAARGGAENPAALDFGGTVAALAQAAAQFVAGGRPAGVSYAGAAPAGLLLHAWTGTPWLPLLLQYQVDFGPMEYIDHRSGARYPADFIDEHFSLPVGGVDFQYAHGVPRDLQAYSGSALLTDGAVVDLAGEIQRFLSNTGSTDPELTAVLARLRTLPLLAQRLTGTTQAMLMQSLVLQMPVSDPLAAPPAERFVATVAAAVSGENGVAPLPEVSFNPLRAGTLTIRRLRLVDAFGRFKDYDAPSVLLSSALRPPDELNLPAGTAFLPPRITQPSRLLFRWLAASDDTVETNSHPATTPVIGWVVPDWLGRALAVYSAAGLPLGQFALSADETSVLWTPAPGGPFAPSAGIEEVFARQNRHLRDFALAVYGGGDAAFLAPFFAAVRDSLDFTLPAAFRENAETAVLVGQPLAIARAGLSLEVPGGTAPSQSWASFRARVLDGAQPDDAGLGDVRFPVRLGGPQRLDDSLVGFWTQLGGAVDWQTFYAPGSPGPANAATPATERETTGSVLRPAQDTVTLSPRPDGAVSAVLTLLLDPRGSVHATTGVLPVAEITTPPGHDTATAGALSLALAAHPVLSASNAGMALPLPKLSAGGWSWVTVGGDREWQQAGVADAPSAATLDYTPQRISEGWLLLQPAVTRLHPTDDKEE